MVLQRTCDAGCCNGCMKPIIVIGADGELCIAIGAANGLVAPNIGLVLIPGVGEVDACVVVRHVRSKGCLPLPKLRKRAHHHRLHLRLRL